MSLIGSVFMYPIEKMLIRKQRNAATKSSITVRWSMYIPNPKTLVVIAPVSEFHHEDSNQVKTSAAPTLFMCSLITNSARTRLAPITVSAIIPPSLTFFTQVGVPLNNLPRNKITGNAKNGIRGISTA